uniref:Uncharacterized protein n=1 Tax=Anguilla anguilla TaxID=7936 RepID=A0A0E9QWV7_ANGAN
MSKIGLKYLLRLIFCICSDCTFPSGMEKGERFSPASREGCSHF